MPYLKKEKKIRKKIFFFLAKALFLESKLTFLFHQADHAFHVKHPLRKVDVLIQSTLAILVASSC